MAVVPCVLLDHVGDDPAETGCSAVWPGSTRLVDEWETLTGFLDYQRATFAWKSANLLPGSETQPKFARPVDSEGQAL